MTAITYGHGYLNDMDDASYWGAAINSPDPLSNVSITSDGDVITIYGETDSVNNEYVYYEKDITNISSDVYTTFLIRWKTSVLSNGLGFCVTLVFDDASEQYLIGSANPEFSGAWRVNTATITAGKNIDKIRIIADDYPNNCPNGGYYVYIDFKLLCKGTFTFPNPGTRMTVEPEVRKALLDIFGRSGDITQLGGTKSVKVHCMGDLDVGDWTRTGDTINGEVFLDIWHNSKTEPWQWLDTGYHQFKVTMGTPLFRYDQKHTVEIDFDEYRLGSADGESYVERLGTNL